MRREALITSVSALIIWSALAATAQPSANKIKILERGIYRAETIKQTDTPGTTGLINTVQNTRLVVNTTNVVGQVGVRFGLRYVFLGTRSDVPLKLVITFPPGGLRNPDTREVFLHNEHQITVPTATTLYWEYHFEHEWEIVACLWDFQFWYQDQKLAEQRFCVHAMSSRSPTLGLSKECGFRPLGSTLPDRRKRFGSI